VIVSIVSSRNGDASTGLSSGEANAAVHIAVFILHIVSNDVILSDVILSVVL
jgi:hypothetical protein